MARVTSALWFICISLLYYKACADTKSQAAIQYFTENGTTSSVEGKTNSKIEERPYMVSVRIKPHWWSKSLHCDAAVVGDRWALTSARCCVNHDGTPYAPKKICLRTGSATLKPEGLEYKVANVILKDSYHLNSIDNNLCLLKVQETLSLSSYLKPIVLAESEDYQEGASAKVSGWSNMDGSSTNQLVTVTLPLITNSRCRELYTETGKAASVITDRLICATAERGSCHGADASPLVVNGKLAGIVTAGNGCGNNPGVFTKISEYRDWIIQHIFTDQVLPDIDVRSKFTR